MASFGAVTWRRWAALSTSLRAVTWHLWAALSAVSAAVTWHRWAASLGSLGAGDVASLDGFVGSVGGGGCVDEPAPAWPNAGSHWGAQRRQWRPRVVVDGGGTDERVGWSRCVTLVTFQPRLLDLATRGRLLLINGNY